MHPGQLTPNDFECAILKRIAAIEPLLLQSELHVLSREFTGVGSFTKFECRSTAGGERHLSLDGLIHMPGVPNGMGAVLLCKGHEPELLEIFTYGNDHWDGIYDGFSIESSA